MPENTDSEIRRLQQDLNPLECVSLTAKERTFFGMRVPSLGKEPALQPPRPQPRLSSWPKRLLRERAGAQQSGLDRFLAGNISSEPSWLSFRTKVMLKTLVNIWLWGTYSLQQKIFQLKNFCQVLPNFSVLGTADLSAALLLVLTHMLQLGAMECFDLTNVKCVPL